MTSAVFVHFIIQYGYIGLFGILGISILGLPIPDEFLMTYVGFLSFSGKLHPVLAILSAALGSMTGITIAYFLGIFFEQKVLTHLEKHAGDARLKRVLSWYQRHGGKLLTIGYFIPGVRHLSGYIAGLSRLRYRSFAVYSYLGALLWTTLFISLGRGLGSRWESILPAIHRYALILGIGGSALLLVTYLLYKNHEQWGKRLLGVLRRLPERYISLGKRRFFVTIGGTLFLTLFIFLMGLIQDLVAREVGEFDELVTTLLALTSPPLVIHFMQYFIGLGTHLMILMVFIIAALSFYRKSKRWTHLFPLGLAWGGGTLLDHLFRYIFRGENINIFENLTPFHPTSSVFLIAAFSFYAVLGYLSASGKPPRQQWIILLFGLCFEFLLGLSPIYLRLHTPSSMVTSMTVSGLWSLVCLFLYEFQRYRLEETSIH